MKITYNQAVDAQKALVELNNIPLPVKVGLEIARLSNALDEEVKVFIQERTKLIKDYQIEPSHGEDEGMFTFITKVEGKTPKETKKLKESNLRTFADNMKELLESETKDIGKFRITIPDDVKLKPKTLKAIAGFIGVS